MNRKRIVLASLGLLILGLAVTGLILNSTAQPIEEEPCDPDNRT